MVDSLMSGEAKHGQYKSKEIEEQSSHRRISSFIKTLHVLENYQNTDIDEQKIFELRDRLN